VLGLIDDRDRRTDSIRGHRVGTARIWRRDQKLAQLGLRPAGLVTQASA
jgi:hypothetical protein